MKISREQLGKIRALNETLKDLDPLLKERLIDLELYALFKDDYLKVAPRAKSTESRTSRGDNKNKPNRSATIKDAITAKGFFDEKKPRTSTETVAVFGFYLEHYENKTEFSEDDIAQAYFDARVRKPKVIGQALRDSKNVKGYLVEGSKKGLFRLSNVGENLVLHDLPQQANK
jgi:hypothetical protein